VTEDAKAEVGILIEDFPLRPVLGQMLGDKVRIRARLLYERANLLAALGARIGRKDPVTIGGELFESIGHRQTLLSWIGERDAERRDYAVGAAWTRAAQPM
jgi:hypothetical protein